MQSFRVREMWAPMKPIASMMRTMRPKGKLRRIERLALLPIELPQEEKEGKLPPKA